MRAYHLSRAIPYMRLLLLYLRHLKGFTPKAFYLWWQEWNTYFAAFSDPTEKKPHYILWMRFMYHLYTLQMSSE